MGRRTFSKEYKLQTIKQVIEEGKRIADISVSEALGITERTIYRWLREYDKYGDEAFKGQGNARRMMYLFLLIVGLGQLYKKVEEWKLMLV